MIRAIVRDFPLESIPIANPYPESFRDPRDEKVYKGYKVALPFLTEPEWQAIFDDMKDRFPDRPSSLEAFKTAIAAQGGLPVRLERVVMMTHDAADLMKWFADDDDGPDDWDEEDDSEDDDEF